jgi:uncharacterized Fe-S cluster-containing radical SAM superfamily enzyme
VSDRAPTRLVDRLADGIGCTCTASSLEDLLSPEIVQQLNDAGLTHLQLSVDGVTPNATTVKVLKPLR